MSSYQYELSPCLICLDPIHAKKNQGLLDQCGHAFHFECIYQWFDIQKKNTFLCPICRKENKKIIEINLVFGQIRRDGNLEKNHESSELDVYRRRFSENMILYENLKKNYDDLKKQHDEMVAMCANNKKKIEEYEQKIEEDTKTIEENNKKLNLYQKHESNDLNVDIFNDFKELTEIEQRIVINNLNKKLRLSELENRNLKNITLNQRKYIFKAYKQKSDLDDQKDPNIDTININRQKRKRSLM